MPRQGMPGGGSLVAMLKDTKNEGKGNRVRVVFARSKSDFFFDIPRESWYSITVAEFYKIVAQKLPEDHPPGALFLSMNGREQLLAEYSLLSAYDITNENNTLLLKPKPKTVNVFFHKRFYVDEDSTVQDVIPLIHYALARHEWIDEENQLFVATEDSEAISIDKMEGFLPESLESCKFNKLSDSDCLSTVADANTPTFFLSDDAKPLLACEPTSVVEIKAGGPKQKR
mgnify:CR=1 FL=1